MVKQEYESPEWEICWFETEDICKNSILIENPSGDGVVDDDDW